MLLACLHASPPVGQAEPCERLMGALRARVAEGGPVRVVVEGEVALPAGFVEEARTAGLVQGTLPGDQLCALADLPGVVRVRAPFEAAAK